MSVTFLTNKHRAVIDGQLANLTEELNSHVEKSTNLIDPANRESGNIDTSGNETESTYERTGYISVTPGGTYTMFHVVNIATYDIDYNFIKRLSVSSDDVRTLTLADNVYYIRVTSNSKLTWYLNEGDTLVEEPYHAPRISSNIGIDNHLDTTLTESGKAADAGVVGTELAKLNYKSVYDHSPYKIFASDFAGWYENQQSDLSLGIRANTYTEVIAMFDNVMDQSNGYITKQELGIASGTDAGGNAYTLYEYTLSPNSYVNGSRSQKMPKVLIQCGIHGFEKCSTYGLYYLVKDLVENWSQNTRLAAIRQHVEIKCIPVLNPSGWDADTYTNANGVNINRNYLVPNWTFEETGKNASGAEPFDQPESQISKAWVEANTDALVFIDGHTNGRYYTSGYANMNACIPVSGIDDIYYKRSFDACSRHIEDQTAILPTMYESVNPPAGTFCGYIQAAAHVNDQKGTASRWCSAYTPVIGMTLEGFNGLKDSDDNIVSDLCTQSTKKINSEIIGNVMSAILREYAD